MLEREGSWAGILTAGGYEKGKATIYYYKIMTIRNYKRLILSIFGITIFAIVVLTIQAVYETEDWAWFKMDYVGRGGVISSYGTLIGGVLAFLSILFVLFQVYEQREQIQQEQQEKVADYQEELRNRLMLMSFFIDSLINDIIRHGERMKDYFEKEKTFPSTMNTMYFTVNGNFSRVVEMDVLSSYKAFQFYFNAEENWEKLFLNTYNLIDFYSEALNELKTKYSLHIGDKVKEQKEISNKIHEFLKMGASLVDEYLLEYNKETYLSHPWPALMNKIVPEYYFYLEECQNKNEVANFRYLSDNFFLPFLNAAMIIRKEEGYDSYGSRELVERASFIRKKINEVEGYAIQYAEDIEKQFVHYFSKENSNIKELEEINLKIKIQIKREI